MKYFGLFGLEKNQRLKLKDLGNRPSTLVDLITRITGMVFPWRCSQGKSFSGTDYVIGRVDLVDLVGFALIIKKIPG